MLAGLHCCPHTIANIIIRQKINILRDSSSNDWVKRHNQCDPEAGLLQFLCHTLRKDSSRPGPRHILFACNECKIKKGED